jgi:hypothetical protein
MVRHIDSNAIQSSVDQLPNSFMQSSLAPSGQSWQLPSPTRHLLCPIFQNLLPKRKPPPARRGECLWAAADDRERERARVGAEHKRTAALLSLGFGRLCFGADCWVPALDAALDAALALTLAFGLDAISSSLHSHHPPTHHQRATERPTTHVPIRLTPRFLARLVSTP